MKNKVEHPTSSSGFRTDYVFEETPEEKAFLGLKFFLSREDGFLESYNSFLWEPYSSHKAICYWEGHPSIGHDADCECGLYALKLPVPIGLLHSWGRLDRYCSLGFIKFWGEVRPGLNGQKNYAIKGSYARIISLYTTNKNTAQIYPNAEYFAKEGKLFEAVGRSEFVVN